jgi:tetratricopeptide (TPR) repeat protein/predicted Ser/Thr protein kinase
MSRPSESNPETAPATGLATTPGDYGFAPGERVGRHVVLERIGGGGMGVVYAAYDPKLDRRVALKLLRPDATGTAGAQGRLLREAQTLARLAHPNVVNVYDAGEIDGRLYVEMELVQGRTLSEWLAAEPRDWRAVVGVFVQAGRGLAAAHAVGIVHRDFKPDNVLVGDDGRVRVADFGIALPASAEVPAAGVAGAPVDDAQTSAPPVVRSLAKSGAGVGTPAYMAPEQWSSGKPDARADQYSFCLSLYEALHGARPGAGGSGPGALPRKPPAWLDRAIARGLHLSPERRHASMEALLDVLELEPRRRRLLALAAAALAGVALVGGGTWAAVRHHERGQARVCSGADREIARVWGDPNKPVVEAAFARTGLPYAARAASQVTLALDRYAREWAQMHADACEATRVRGEQSEAILDRRMQCLDRRLAEVRTLTEIFEKGDPKVVARAALATQRLSPVTDCTAARARATPALARRDPAAADALGRATALDAAGKYADAIQVAEGALDGARASGEVAIEAQALELVGRSASKKGDGPRAEKALFDAFVAAQKSGDDAVAALAAIESGFAIGYLQSRGDEAEKWFRLADVAIARVGGDPHLAVERVYSKSAVSWSAGKFKDSIADTRQALKMSEEKLPGDTLERAYCLTGLGVGLMSQGETAEARGFLEEALAIDQDVLGPDHPNVEMDLFNLGTCAKADARYEDAMGFFTRAIDIGEKEPGGMMLVLSLGAMAEAQARLGKLGDARANVERALKLADGNEAVEASRRADLYATRAKVARLDRRYDDARRDYDEAIAIDAKALAKDDPDQASAQIGLAEVLLEQGKAKSALPLLERALVLDKDLDESELAEPRLVLAQALWQTGDRARSAELAKQARAYYARFPAKKGEVAEVEAWFAKNGGP